MRAGEPFAIESADALGLALASWPGRWQTLREPGASFYLDGAHTAESVEACAGWFAAASASASLKQRRRALVFNTTGDRDAGRILAPLRAAGFHLVVFCPNVMAATDTAPKGPPISNYRPRELFLFGALDLICIHSCTARRSFELETSFSSLSNSL